MTSLGLSGGGDENDFVRASFLVAEQFLDNPAAAKEGFAIVAEARLRPRPDTEVRRTHQCLGSDAGRGLPAPRLRGRAVPPQTRPGAT